MQSGSKLPDHLKAAAETVFGRSFGDVQIHYNSAKPAQLGAHAYARGTDIHLAPGVSNPHSASGINAIGHELAHVVQQGSGRVPPTAGAAINDDPALEREADAMGQRVAAIASKA